jgi:adenylosuccinate synthase
VFHLISDDITQDRKVLLEGAQGVMLDIDHGTYPYVTSSNSSVGGACTGLGIPPSSIKKVLGIIKAYTTRVGEGPFPTELKGEQGNLLRELGKEYGATTGRPRRCGWFDGVVAQFSAKLNGITHLALTKLDVLDSSPRIKVCIGYKYGNKMYDEMPASLKVLENCEPFYQEYEGWMCPTTGIDDFNKLPDKAKTYVEGICNQIGIEFAMISTGQRRDETIILKKLF